MATNGQSVITLGYMSAVSPLVNSRPLRRSLTTTLRRADIYPAQLKTGSEAPCPRASANSQDPKSESETLQKEGQNAEKGGCVIGYPMTQPPSIVREVSLRRRTSG
ncbi:hypothetical protein GCM10010211_26360 [Streptomyces albospinus]|uniref:Uncharacterized protein n=1 Tax=Streptomyces albospinus TaxID=285515 RepID=A0ABQ2V1D7_9ACTN|nr:hypothetical protein GCM10010211_26360 [Streptomyces albospinus]